MADKSRGSILGPLIFLGATLTAIAAQAQSCADWNNVNGWAGNYTLTGSGTAPSSDGQWSVEINHKETANVTLPNSVAACPSTLFWSGA